MRKCVRLAHVTLLFSVILGTFFRHTSRADDTSGAGNEITSASKTSAVSAIWANDGGDKVTRDELRVFRNGSASVQNSVWDGKSVRLSAARNEVIAFNLVLEASKKLAPLLSIKFDKLTGPNAFLIGSKPAAGNQIFEWTSREIELFLVRYLQIKGLSRLSYEVYDERHVPERMRRPLTWHGHGLTGWNNRPDHDKYYPEIAVPLEAVNNEFHIASDSNQSIWVDIYVPKEAPAGLYHGNIEVRQDGATFASVPVQLHVRKFTLPDEPSAKTMLFLGYADLAPRYLGQNVQDGGASLVQGLRQIRDRHFKLAHRHKISLIDADPGYSVAPRGRPRDEWLPRLDGTLFTSEHGYAGPGQGSGNGIYSIGTYSTWDWRDSGRAGMWSNTDLWARWFAKNAKNTEHFLYLIDESTDLAKIEQWASWVATNPGPGRAIYTFATVALPSAVASIPSLTAIASWFTVGPTDLWQKAFNKASNTKPSKWIIAYNGKRPSNGSFATEDDGIALRELVWAQQKMGIHRWFFWESTYYKDFQNGRGEANLFREARTFGGQASPDHVMGMKGYNYSNGDGVLFYPGTDLLFPEDSYGLMGPIASLRLKHWRRGIQDADYLKLAAVKKPALVRAIINRMVPKALWEYGVTDSKDPSWVRSDISWSNNPDDWEKARAELTNIIEGD